jgi:long-chain fatty acid transport protein
VIFHSRPLRPRSKSGDFKEITARGPNPSIGVGWRSGVDQKIDGSLNVGAPIPFSTPGPVNTTLDLPAVVSVGVRHRFDERWTLLGTAEWTNWSRIGTSLIG